MITVGKSSAFPELICYFSTSQVSDVDDFLNNKTRNRLGARKIAKKTLQKTFLFQEIRIRAARKHSEITDLD